MSTRLATGGRLIDRTRPLGFSFDGARLRGYAGDTLASALLANDRMLVGRSFKYHRPRGILASGAEEPNALLGLGTGARFEPNVRATQQALFEGATATSQNAWPSLAFDIGILNDLAARLLPAGFYYKTFIHPRPFWKHLFEPVIRRAAGLGRAPREADADRYEQLYAFADVLVAGGGVAGIAAALAAAATGARVILAEQTAHWGGRAPVDGDRIDGQSAAEWVAAARSRLGAMANVTLLPRTMVAGVYDHGYVLAEETLADDPAPGHARRRLWRIRARRIIAATGAIERPLAFAGNDRPGVMLASAVRDYVVNWAVSPGDRTVIVTNNDDAYRTALALLDAGLAVPAILDARPEATGALPAALRARGVRVEAGRAVARVLGRGRVRAVQTCLQAGEGAVIDEIPCEAVAMSGGWSPVVHLWSHCGGKLRWDEGRAMFAPDPARPPTGADGAAMVIAAGAASGALHATDCLRDGHEAGRRAAAEGGGRDGPQGRAASEYLAVVRERRAGAAGAARKRDAVAALAPAQELGLHELLSHPILAPNPPVVEVQAYTAQRVPPLKIPTARADWEAYRQDIRRRVLDDVIFRGEAKAWRDEKVRVEWLETIPGGPGYRIKKLRYEAVPGMWVPSLLYEPERLQGKVPVVINVNGHDVKDGKAADYKQTRCINQAKRGLLALNVEWLGMGQLNTPGFGHYKMNQLDLTGTSGIAPFYLAMKRAIDVALEHPNADPERVAVTGLSGGGWQTIFI
ncbi:MAG: 2Fe-2S iron-sulfur cluster-binding protein, partial [Gemmobacter sp.]